MSISGVKGKCLCGKVEVTVAHMSSDIGVCHCSMCRQWGGGPYFSVDCGSDVTFSDEAYVSRYASSAWARRGFCTHCGTHLFYQLMQTGAYHMPAGLFRLPETVKLKSQIFIDEKPHYYALANNTPMLTSEQVIAMFTQKDKAQ